jgi:CubicO group peptidase (beta-lactamase class C family)
LAFRADLKDTVFVLRPDQQARVASVHARGADGKLSPIEFSMPQAPEFFMGGGGLYAIGRDYRALLRALLGGGKLDNAQILKPETATTMNRGPSTRHGRRNQPPCKGSPSGGAPRPPRMRPNAMVGR